MTAQKANREARNLGNVERYLRFLVTTATLQRINEKERKRLQHDRMTENNDQKQNSEQKYEKAGHNIG